MIRKELRDVIEIDPIIMPCCGNICTKIEDHLPVVGEKCICFHCGAQVQYQSDHTYKHIPDHEILDVHLKWIIKIRERNELLKAAKVKP